MFLFCSNTAWVIRVLIKKTLNNKRPTHAPNAVVLADSEHQKQQILRSGQQLPAAAHPPRWGIGKILKEILKIPVPPAPHLSGQPFQQAFSCRSSIYWGFPAEARPEGSPLTNTPKPPQQCPHIGCLLPPVPAREHQPSCYTGNAIVIQLELYSFSFLQAFIYSVPCILHLQVFLLQEGFLAEAAPICLEIFFSTCFCIILKCCFESQLRTNLIEGFFRLHKGRLQKHGRKGWVKNQCSGTNTSFNSRFDWFATLGTYRFYTTILIQVQYTINPDTNNTRCCLLCFLIKLREFYSKTEHILKMKV